MKNIIIIGCPRAGKTTLANMLCKKMNYKIISTDSLVSAFEQNFPQIGITRKDGFREKSKKMVPFIYTYLKKYKEDYPNERFIIEGCQLMPYHIMNTFDRNEFECICLGYPNSNSLEVLRNIRKNDEKDLKSYSRKLSDEELLVRIDSWIALSKFLKNEAKSYRIPFIETDKDRNAKLNEICECIFEKESEKIEKER